MNDNPIMKLFEFNHLPEYLQIVSLPFCATARSVHQNLPDSAEKSAVLLKLLEAKDAAVKAKFEQQRR